MQRVEEMELQHRKEIENETMLNDDWETITDREIKRMTVSCITRAARREIKYRFFNGSSNRDI